MIRAWIVVLGLAMMGGCATKTAPVEMSMKRNMADDVTSLVLKSVELNHKKNGWVSVAVSEAESTENGTEIGIGTADLPAGTYTGARARYVRTTRVVTPTKTIKRMDPADEAEAAADDGKKTVTRDETPKEAEAAPDPGTPVIESNEGMATTESEFCVSKDGSNVLLVVKDKDGTVMLKVKGPGC